MGYLLKDGVASGTTLVDALRRLTAGECVVDPRWYDACWPERAGPIRSTS